MALKRNESKENDMEMIKPNEQVKSTENGKKSRKAREHKDKFVNLILDCGNGEAADKDNFKIVGACENPKKVANAMAEAQLALAGHWLAVGEVVVNNKKPLDAKLVIGQAVRQQVG